MIQRSKRQPFANPLPYAAISIDSKSPANLIVERRRRVFVALSDDCFPDGPEARPCMRHDGPF
jgi:hypothetical protein